MQSEVIHSQGIYKVWAWFETNKKAVAGGALAALVIGLVVWFIVWQQNEKQVSASQALSSVFATQMANPHAADSEGYLKIASNYPNSSAGERALLLAAGNLFTEGKFSEAQAQFEKFVREHRDSPFIAEAQLGVAACLDAEGKTDQAIAAYKQLIERHPTQNVIPQAKFALAHLYEQQNKPEQAYKLYEEVGRDMYGSLGSEAGMRAEELKLKFPNLGTPPASPSVAPTAPSPMGAAGAPKTSPAQKK